MQDHACYDIFCTPIGWCAVVACREAVQRIVLAHARREHVLSALAGQYPGCRADRDACRAAIDFIQQYFQFGAAARPPAAIDPGPASAFQRSVWDVTRGIAFGQVRTYGWIAERIGCPGGARAVGTALGRNPLPLIVPCHRVVRSSGAPGGFSAPGGTSLKRRLLAYEGVL